MFNNQCSELIFTPKWSKLYLFKDLGPQSVGLRYSSLFFLLLSLCHLWQHVVNPTERKKAYSYTPGEYSIRSSRVAEPCQQTGIVETRFYLARPQPVKNLDPLINRSRSDSFFIPTTTANLSRDPPSQIMLLLKKKNKKLQWAAIIWSGVPFQIREEKKQIRYTEESSYLLPRHLGVKDLLYPYSMCMCEYALCGFQIWQTRLMDCAEFKKTNKQQRAMRGRVTMSDLGLI